MVKLELINNDLDDNWFKRIPLDLLLNLDGLNGMLFLKYVLIVKD